jgi:hypothetical protein
MDGILKVNKLKLHQFQLHYHQDLKKRRIEITCRHPTDHDDNDPTVKKLLGYMLFTWPLRNNPNKEGVLEMCNFNASLYERNFKLGNTTKANDKDQAGEHGEGFKIAAMVLRRHPQNYSVRAMASERFIDFKFSGKGEIAACVSSLKTKKKERDLAEFEELSDNGKCRPLKPKVWEDVTFIIGVQRKVKDARGRQCPTSRIPLATFEDWLSVTTHVKPPKQRFQTPYGTLILEEAYINKMYLRGLLLPNGSSSRHKYKYGYDFPEGKTNRDREGLKSSGQREQMITNIWSFAICENLEFMKMYCGLLLTPQDSRSADVFCAEDYLNKDDILRIWGFLKLDSGLNDAFYYCEGKDREVCFRNVFREIKD